MIRKFSTLLFVFFLFNQSSVCFAQAKDKIPVEYYKASTMPDSLKENAESVVRYSFEEYSIKTIGKAVSKQRYIVTILNEKGDHEAEIGLPYDKKFTSVSDIEISFYNANGELIKRYKKKDMYDHAMYDDISILTDNRVLLLKHSPTSYPVTMDMQVEYDFNGYINLARWDIMKFKQSVQYSAFKISVLPEVGVRFKNYNTTISPKESSEKGLLSYNWEVVNRKAITQELDAPAWTTLPYIDFVPAHFVYDNKPGDIDSWKNYGNWIRNLNAEVNTLPQKRVEEIQAMTAGIKTDKEKAKFLYEYLQKNMRYVSIQLGIGGLKPFPASFVDEKKYGDCKALANYMQALLKAVNIKSYYTLVRAGENEESPDPDFTCDRSNHIILCIPFENDTTWIECTSNTQPFGKLGTFTENRYALLITEDGGQLVKTPASTKEDNTFVSESKIVLLPDGSATAHLSVKAKGEYRSMYIANSFSKSDDQKTFFIKSLNLKQPDVLNINYGEDNDGVKELDLELAYAKFPDMASSDKLFYRPRLFDVWQNTFPKLEQRKTDFYFDHPLQKINTTIIELPENFEVETIPANVSLKFSYGNYETSYLYDKASNQLKSITRLDLDARIIPAKKYQEMQQFMDEISKSLNKKLVIRKKT